MSEPEWKPKVGSWVTTELGTPAIITARTEWGVQLVTLTRQGKSLNLGWFKLSVLRPLQAK